MTGDGEPVFPASAFERLDETPDAVFYAAPRFVAHIDAAAIAAVTDLYRRHFPAGGELLDLMSSWVSHLPADVAYGRVAGLGMNSAELEANPRLTDWCVQDLNAQPALPYAAAAFDGCGPCVSFQYLTRPIEVLREVRRVLRPGAPLIVTFSNRCFPTKAVRLWHALDDRGHADYVAFVMERAGFPGVTGQWTGGPAAGSDPLIAVIGRA